jgi:hypothetical protein
LAVLFALSLVPVFGLGWYARVSGYRVGWLLIPVGTLLAGSLGYALFQPWLRRRFRARRE